MKFYEVFKAGTYPQGKFTKKEIAQIAKNYDPQFCEAPITIDHQQSGPAYGWVDTVKADGDKLKVSFKEVPEEFEKDVNDGKYKKVSVELYRNLEGKGAYLKAVSFLGAAIPQVKGLEPIKFMESEADTFEFNAEDEPEQFSQQEIEDLKNQVADLEKQLATFKESNKKLETIKSLKEKISALSDEVATFKEKAQGKEEIEKELNDIKTSLKKKEFEEFIDKQIEKGTLVPANKNIVLSVLQELDNVKKFGEDSTVVLDFKSFIESLPNQIKYGEFATKEKQTDQTNEDVEKFANADEESVEIFKEAKALAAKENISFKVNRGETIAFIGSTGSGKSTLINLVPRFYDATEGEVLIDGVNVKEYKTEALNNKLGYVPQKAVMFAGTVNYNISYGDNGKEEISQEKIKEAATIAQADEFIEKMDKQYETPIAQGGTNVSGGQKQRLAIARAIAKDPEIYIFDDSFSALDYKTDAVLRKELKNYTKNATSLIVAQRIGTIMNADKIVVLDSGKCVGIGTHKELLKTCDIYKQIALSQLSKEELENA